MSRINWPTVASADVELVVAVLIHREHPRAQRLRPSRGDQGVDVLDPIDATTEDAYQIKSFSGALTPILASGDSR